MIFLALAIQLGYLGDRLSAATVRPADCLTLCDGRLLAILYDTADAEQRESIVAASAQVRVVGVGVVRPLAAASVLAPAGLDRLGVGITPMPPPLGF